MTAVTIETAPRARVAAALRRVTVVPLADLHGPSSCCIKLPVEVCWSLPPERRWFDLTDLDQVRAAYGFIFSAARAPEHITEHVNAGLLAAAWPINLPRRARQAWEAANPQLVTRPAGAAAA
jgi:hypothetical protein